MDQNISSNFLDQRIENFENILQHYGQILQKRCDQELEIQNSRNLVEEINSKIHSGHF